MTITVAANNARIRYTATSSQTAFAIPFEFFENDEIHVYVASTALVAASERGQGTGSTEYGISGGGGSTGAIAFVTGITQGHIVTIVRDIPIERITDFTAGTTINRAALNTQLDTLTAMVGDLKDKSDRAIRLQPYDSEITLFLPTIGSRAGKIFGFDTNGNLTADTSANFDITLDDVVTNTLTMTGNADSKINLTAVLDSQIVTNGAVLNIKSTKGSNTATMTLDGSTTYGIDFNAGDKAIRMQDATLFSSTAEVTGALTAPLIISQSGGSITLQPTGNQVFIKGTSGESRIAFHNPAAPSMEFTGDSSLIGSGSFLLDIADEIILDSASGSLLIKDAGVLRMTLAFNGAAQTITSANDLTIASSANGISIKPATSSTDFLSTGGAQTIGVISSAGSAHLKWYQNSNTTLLKVVNPTGTRTLLLPDESGTIHSSGGATTHANITVSTDGKVQFRDSAIYIQSGADGHLDLVADTEIHIAATTVNVDGLMDISGNLSVGGNFDVTGTIDFSDADITNVGSIALDRLTNDGTAGILLDSSTGINLDSSTGQIVFKDDNSTRLTFAVNNSANQTITSLAILSLTSGGDINLRPNGGQLYVLNNSGGDNFQFNTSSTPTLGIHQNSNVTNLGLVNPTATRNILFPDASDTLVGKATTDTLTNKTLTAPTLTGTAVVASLDISGDIDVYGTTNLDVVDIDGAVNIATTALVTGILTTTAATVFNGGFASNANSTVGGTLGVTGVVTANAGVVVDNFTLDGTTLALSSGNFTLDVAGDIVLDAAGTEVQLFKSGTKFGKFTTNSTPLGFYIDAEISDGDMFFRGNDGGSTITALTLDMSEAGDAHFNRNIGVGFPALPTGAAFDSIRLGGQGFFMANSNTNANGITAMAHNAQYDADSSWEYILTDEAEYYYQSAGSHRFLSAPSGTAGNDITFVDRVEFEADGDVRIYDGNLVVATAHGIAFGNASGGTKTIVSNLLDDYEEGTFTPTVALDSGSVASITGSGRYTKIGNSVTATFSVLIGSASSALLNNFTGFPFTSSNINAAAVGSIRETGNAGDQWHIRATPNSTSFLVRLYDNSQGIVAGDQFLGSVTYLTDT